MFQHHEGEIHSQEGSFELDVTIDQDLVVEPLAGSRLMETVVADPINVFKHIVWIIQMRHVSALLGRDPQPRRLFRTRFDDRPRSRRRAIDGNRLMETVVAEPSDVFKHIVWIF